MDRTDIPSLQGARLSVVGLASLLLLTHVLAAGPLLHRLWGAHFFGFFPETVGILAAAGLIAAIALCFAPGRASSALAGRFSRVLRPPVGGLGTRVGIGIAFAAACWLARASHLLLGDGLPLIASVLEGTGFHPYEPLSAALQLRIYETLAPLFAAREPQSWRVAWDALAVGSCCCGGLFAVVVWSLAPEITQPPSATATPSPWPGLLAALLLLSQGYIQVFCGYVENYSFLTLALALYLLLALQHLRGRQPLAAPGMALLLATGLHMSALALAPSFALLTAWELSSTRRRGAVRDIVILMLACVAGVLGLGRLAPGYHTTTTLLDLVRGLLRDPAGGWGRSLTGHLLDIFNEQTLVGPMTALFAIAMFAVVLSRRLALGRRATFLCTAGAGWLAAQWVAGDSNLGYARNWDLLAPGGVVLTSAGLSLMATLVSGESFARLLLVACVVSFHHTGPWIAVNASAERALKRFESLDLGGGRTESTLGFWHALNGDLVSAEAWLKRSVAADPQNVRAHLHLGRLYSQLGRNDAAAVALATALRLRPDLDDARRGLINALVRAGRLSEALDAVNSALAGQPTSARYWAMKAVVLSGLEQHEAALDAASHASTSAPDSAVFSALLGRVRIGASLDSLIATVWPSVVGIRQ